ncbi:MAG: hypothetical protein RL318_6 [Fibrobacterota bacterium]|jgi:hypothetical protein
MVGSINSLTSAAPQQATSAAGNANAVGRAGASAAGGARDQYTSGGNGVVNQDAYGPTGRSMRRVDPEMLQQRRSMQRRLAAQRREIAMDKLAKYPMTPPQPLPVTTPSSILPTVAAVGAGAGLGAGAALAAAPLLIPEKPIEKPIEKPLEKPIEPPAELEKLDPEEREPQVINVEQPEINVEQPEVNVEVDEDGNIITDTAGLVVDGVAGVGGLVWDGVSLVGGVAYDATGAVLSVPLNLAQGAAFGTGLVFGAPAVAAVATDYAVNGTFNPITGAMIIGENAAAGAAYAAPIVSQGLTDIVAGAITQSGG